MQYDARLRLFCRDHAPMEEDVIRNPDNTRHARGRTRHASQYHTPNHIVERVQFCYRPRTKA
jgi:hypothetical protein